MIKPAEPNMMEDKRTNNNKDVHSAVEAEDDRLLDD